LVYSTPLIKSLKTIEFHGSFIQEEELKTLAEKFGLQIEIKVEYISSTALFKFPSKIIELGQLAN